MLCLSGTTPAEIILAVSDVGNNLLKWRNQSGTTLTASTRTGIALSGPQDTVGPLMPNTFCNQWVAGFMICKINCASREFMPINKVNLFRCNLFTKRCHGYIIREAIQPTLQAEMFVTSLRYILAEATTKRTSAMGE